MKVSIIMPAYNVETYIVESIRSICDQKYTDWELIVVDDGSDDETFKKAKAIAQVDSRVEVIHQENKGVSAARNRGIKEAKGEFISFLDADDLWENDFLSEMIKAIEYSRVEVALCGHKRLIKGKRIEVIENYFNVGKDILYYYAKGMFKATSGTMLIRKSSLLQANIKFDETCHNNEDAEFIYKCLVAFSSVVVPKNLMIYRKRYGSATYGCWNAAKEFTAILALERIKEMLIKYEDNAFRKVHCVSILDQKISYTKSNYLWKSIKIGEFDKVCNYLESGWDEDIKKIISLNEISNIKKIKFKILLKKKKMIWRLVFIANYLKYINRKNADRISL